MHIKILGCHGSDSLTHENGAEHCCRTIGFLINDSLMIDAGTISSVLNLESQQRISHVVLTHAHFDHFKELPSLADNLASCVTRPITIASIPSVIENLKTLRLEVFDDPRRRWIPRSPAMASGLTDHIWTVKELLKTVVPPLLNNT